MQYVLGPPVRERNGDALVRLADDARKCVVFIGVSTHRGESDLNPIGTGFFVTTHEPGGVYLVTARHVIQDCLDAPFVIRFNSKSGEGRIEHVDDAEWFFHPTDNTVDVAVLRMDIPDWADCIPIPAGGKVPVLLRKDRFEAKNFGAGDIVYTVGLWKFLYGKRKNLPFVHVGHVGLMPEDERIPVDGWIPSEHGRTVFVEGYLTEGEPLNGASGSPVFIRRSIEKPSIEGGKWKLETWVHGSVWQLGLLSNAFTGAPSEHYQLPPHDNLVSRGINVVVPSMKIYEVLDQPKLVEQRRLAAEEKLISEGRVASKASLAVPQPTDENPKHREDFTSLLGAAAKTKRQDD